MALQSSGQITLKDIWEEVNRATYSSGQINLSALKTAAAESTFNSLSDWYSYSQTLPAPTNLQASINPYNNLHLTWDYTTKGNEVSGFYTWTLEHYFTSTSSWSQVDSGTIPYLYYSSKPITLTVNGIYRAKLRAEASNYNPSSYGISNQVTR